MTRPRKSSRADLGGRLTQLDRILGVHATTDPVHGHDLVIYHRGPVKPDTDLDIGQILLEHASGSSRATSTPRRLRAVQTPAPLDWAYRDLDDMHRLSARVAEGHHRFELDPGQLHPLPDFQPVGDLARGGILADPSGELTLLHRRLQRYPEPLATALAARLWEARQLLEETRSAADQGDTIGTAAGLSRIAALAAHALHGQARTWPPHPARLIADAGKLPGAPPGWVTALRVSIAQLDTRADLVRAVTRTTAQVERVTSACRPRPHR